MTIAARLIGAVPIGGLGSAYPLMYTVAVSGVVGCWKRLIRNTRRTKPPSPAVAVDDERQTWPIPETTESTRTGRNGMALPLGSRATACTSAQSVGWGWAWVVHSNVVVWLRVEPHPGARAATRMTSRKRKVMKWTPRMSCYRGQSQPNVPAVSRA